MITITLTGFKTKKQAIAWLNQYEGALEQCFDTDDPIEFPAMCDMPSYIEEMKMFEEDENKSNFNLRLQ